MTKEALSKKRCRCPGPGEIMVISLGAAGIEMIHQFACIHGGIVDKCNGWRGIVALSGRLEREYPGSGTSMALIAADALYSHGLITADVIRAHLPDIHQQIYLCRPEPMMTATEGLLAGLDIDKSNIVKDAV